MERKRLIDSKIINVFLLLLLLCVVLYEVIDIRFTENQVLIPMIDMSVTRFAAGLFFLIIVIKYDYRVIRWSSKESLKKLLTVLPCFLIVLNNFPIIACLNGDVKLVQPTCFIFLFAVQCIAIGFFEEIAFRGLFFLFFLKERRSNRKQIFLTIASTSIIFGLYHLFNLFEGASPGPVIMQVGYSALIGAMCATVLLITENILIPVFLHAVFDFCGGLFPTLGKGEIWNVPTIIITVVLSVVVFVYMLCVFLKYDIKESDCFYLNN